VLVVTASYDAAAELVLRALREMGAQAFRLDTDRFPSEVLARFRPPSELCLSYDGETIQAISIRAVWYRRHVAPVLTDGIVSGVRDFCERETRAFLDGVLATLPVQRWMSQPQSIRLAERKPYQLGEASRLGFKIPETMITNDPRAVRTIHGRYELVAKAISSGYIMHDDDTGAIFTSHVSPADLEDLEGLRLAPVTFQEYIAKKSDIRVTCIGKTVFAAELLSQERESSRIDWRATDDPLLPHQKHELPIEVARRCTALVENLGLAFGAIDLALTPAGDYVFFEINPNGEWLWLQDRLGFPIAEAIAQWLVCTSD
jgi:hypothetical protein